MGDETKRHPQDYWSGMYANASTGLAVLRRDGFASMESGAEEGVLLTRKLKFSGKYLFVNIDGAQGQLLAEICQEDGKPITGFRREDSIPVSANSTKQLLTWKDKDSLESLMDQTIRIRFYVTRAKLYAFWISKNRQGASGGAIAAGGPGLSGYWDT